MTDEVIIEIDDREAMASLRSAKAAGQDLSPLMSDVAGIMEDAIERAFLHEQDPATGAAWAPLKPSTKARRRGTSLKILQDSGSMVQSIGSDYDDDSAVAGVSEIYGITHFLGAKKGQYGRTSRGGPIPWGDIPARRFLGLSDEDEEEILEAVSDYFSSAFRV